ncbi:MAG: OmpA family protein [Bacteroidia bacterium]|nr:OmpA family protein [Bacteroidia bacterium]
MQSPARTRKLRFLHLSQRMWCGSLLFFLLILRLNAQSQTSHLVSVTGVVLDRDSGQPLDSALVFLSDAHSQPLDTLLTDEAGNWKRMVMLKEKVREIHLKFQKEGYFGQETKLFLSSSRALPPLTIGLLARTPRGPGMVLDRSMPRFIYFPEQSDQFLEKHKTDLEKVATYLEENPKARLHLTCFTGQLEKHIKPLSRKRGLTVQRFLAEKGIDPHRIEVEAIGRGSPINNPHDAREDAPNRGVKISYNNQQTP